MWPGTKNVNKVPLLKGVGVCWMINAELFSHAKQLVKVWGTARQVRNISTQESIAANHGPNSFDHVFPWDFLDVKSNVVCRWLDNSVSLTFACVCFEINKEIIILSCRNSVTDIFFAPFLTSMHGDYAMLWLLQLCNFASGATSPFRE